MREIKLKKCCPNYMYSLFRVGDVITNVEKLEGGWWKGYLRGVAGMFPDNFVKVGIGSYYYGIGSSQGCSTDVSL